MQSQSLRCNTTPSPISWHVVHSRMHSQAAMHQWSLEIDGTTTTASAGLTVGGCCHWAVVPCHIAMRLTSHLITRARQWAGEEWVSEFSIPLDTYYVISADSRSTLPPPIGPSDDACFQLRQLCTGSIRWQLGTDDWAGWRVTMTQDSVSSSQWIWQQSSVFVCVIGVRRPRRRRLAAVHQGSGQQMSVWS